MSLQKNFIYSCILAVSTYVFPLIVYPYVSRTLGITNIGVVNFVDNLINFFVLVSMMGINTVGVREIAASRGNEKKLSQTFMSLFSLTAITTLIAIGVLLIAMFIVPKLFPYRDLLYIGLIKLAFNFFLVEWFFMGIEDFRYITTRSIFVKCIYVASIFLFVRTSLDFKIYYIISVAMVLVNSVINISYIRKFIHFQFSEINIRPYLPTFIIMGIYVLITNIYTSLNVVWLGFVTNDNEVGAFTTATKLHTIIMSILGAFTTILFPRVSNLLSEGKVQEFWQKITLAFEAIFLFAFPIIAFMLIAGPDLLHLIVGKGFEGAYLPFRIITPLVLIIAIEQILVIQILIAHHFDGIVLRNSIIGALVAVILNVLITENLGAIGSSIVWVMAEICVMCLSMRAIYMTYHYSIPVKRIFQYILAYLPVFALLWVEYHIDINEYLRLFIAIMTICLYAFIVELFVLKNQIALQLYNHGIHEILNRHTRI